MRLLKMICAGLLRFKSWTREHGEASGRNDRPRTAQLKYEAMKRE